MASDKRRTPPRKRPAARPAAHPAKRPAVAAEPPIASQADAHSEFELTNEQVERALQTGEHAGLLEDYFGPDEYQQLRQLARDASARGVRGGPRVLILPGIMGSRIGLHRTPSIFDEVFWFDPIAVAAGRVTQLTLEEPGRRYGSLGVLLIAYLKLKLRLIAAGYDADFHAFDWRRSIADSGRELADLLRKPGGDQTMLVAHSMGGLVARWAIGSGARCRRLVMLGTPNHGSFAPVMALRGTYPIVRKLAALDLRHTAEDLARDVFSTFPGLTQMLPSPDRFHDVDLYDLASWPSPDDGLRPRRAILQGVRDVQRALAKGTEVPCALIAGVDQQTVTGLRHDDVQGFAYELSQDGDGTVPLDLARLPDVPTYYVAESHGSLPNNRVVAQAVVDLLGRGETSALPSTYAAEERRGATRVVPETELRIEPYAGRRGALLSQREQRTMLEEVAAPTSRDELMALVPAAAVGPGAEAAEPGFRHPFDHVVVGRRRQQRIDLRFAFGSITEADARAIALGIFRDVAPSGAARALDERLAGAITDISRRRMFSGNVGEIFILPTGRHALIADHIAFVGLGPFDRFNDEVLQVAAENVIRTFINTRVEEFATVLFGAGSGESPASAVRNLLAGFIRGLCDANKDHFFRRIIICEQDPARYTAIKSELYRLSSTALCQDVEFTFDEVTLPPAPQVVAPSRLARPRVDPAYLIVRQEETRAAEFDVRTSVLTAGAKAAVVTGVRTVKVREFDALRKRIVDASAAELGADGVRLSELLLSEEVRAVLPYQRDRHLVVVHDAEMSRVPWETIAVAGADARKAPWVPAAEKGLTHRYAAENLAVAKWLEERVQDEVLSVLLVANPTQDLAGAAEEGRRVQALFGQVPGCRLDTLWEAAATRPALLAAFGSGKYDIIHYAGHAFFDERSPERSGLLCAGHATLTGADLAGLGRLPTLVFFNACEAGRVRGRAAPGANRNGKVPDPRRPKLQRLQEGVGVAEAFMRGGVANFLGTYWPVGDEPAKLFAEAFYRAVTAGQPLGDAVQGARTAVRETDSKDWADYEFYGNPDFVLKEGAAR